MPVPEDGHNQPTPAERGVIGHDVARFYLGPGNVLSPERRPAWRSGHAPGIYSNYATAPESPQTKPGQNSKRGHSARTSYSIPGAPQQD